MPGKQPTVASSESDPTNEQLDAEKQHANKAIEANLQKTQLDAKRDEEDHERQIRVGLDRSVADLTEHSRLLGLELDRLREFQRRNLADLNLQLAAVRSEKQLCNSRAADIAANLISLNAALPKTLHAEADAQNRLSHYVNDQEAKDREIKMVDDRIARVNADVSAVGASKQQANGANSRIFQNGGDGVGGMIARQNADAIEASNAKLRQLYQQLDALGKREERLQKEKLSLHSEEEADLKLLNAFSRLHFLSDENQKAGSIRSDIERTESFLVGQMSGPFSEQLDRIESKAGAAMSDVAALQSQLRADSPPPVDLQKQLDSVNNQLKSLDELHSDIDALIKKVDGESRCRIDLFVALGIFYHDQDSPPISADPSSFEHLKSAANAFLEFNDDVDVRSALSMASDLDHQGDLPTSRSVAATSSPNPSHLFSRSPALAQYATHMRRLHNRWTETDNAPLLATSMDRPVAAADPGAVELQPLTKKSILLVFAPDIAESEINAAVSACKKYGLQYQVCKNSFDRNADYSNYGAVLAGSNAMYYWQNQNASPAAFSHLDTFMSNGGHLIVFGAFNGSGMQILSQYGVQVGGQHSFGSYRAVPGLTDLLVQGNADLIPQNHFLRCTGNLSCSVNHRVLLWSNPRADGPADGDPAVLTLPAGRGRLTVSTVEPHWETDNPGGHDANWLMTSVISWVSRGCPMTQSESLQPKPDQKSKNTASAVEATNGGPDAAGADFDLPVLLRHAAERDANAMRTIADIYNSGKNGTKDNAEACAWYARSVRLGNSDAISSLSRLSKESTITGQMPSQGIIANEQVYFIPPAPPWVSIAVDAPDDAMFQTSTAVSTIHVQWWGGFQMPPSMVSFYKARFTDEFKDAERAKGTEVVLAPEIIEDARFDIVIHEKIKLSKDVTEDVLHLYRGIDSGVMMVTVECKSSDGAIINASHQSAEKLLETCIFDSKAVQKADPPKQHGRGIRG